jgi:hypothetical protein
MRRRLIYRLFLALGLGLVTFSGVLAQVVPPDQSQPIHSNLSRIPERVIVTVTDNSTGEGMTEIQLRDVEGTVKESKFLDHGDTRNATFELEHKWTIWLICGGTEGDGCIHSITPQFLPAVESADTAAPAKYEAECPTSETHR